MNRADMIQIRVGLMTNQINSMAAAGQLAN
jgi:hypothetical protein